MSNRLDAQTAQKLLSSITTAQSVLTELHPIKHQQECETLRRSILSMREVYARLTMKVKSSPGD